MDNITNKHELIELAKRSLHHSEEVHENISQLMDGIKQSDQLPVLDLTDPLEADFVTWGDRVMQVIGRFALDEENAGNGRLPKIIRSFATPIRTKAFTADKAFKDKTGLRCVLLEDCEPPQRWVLAFQCWDGKGNDPGVRRAFRTGAWMDIDGELMEFTAYGEED
jgi:hypothetical protein